MKIVTWNCKMKFREDHKLVFPLNPDIVVIPECEELDTVDFGDYSKTISDTYWIGDNSQKGLGIVTFNGFKISLYHGYDDRYKFILPLVITKNNLSYNLIGVWTQMIGKKTKDHKNYIRQFKMSMNQYDSFIRPKNSIILGDFNSNLIWENPRRIDSDHKYVVEELQKKEISSSYHHFFNEEQGEETRPTFYYHHKKGKPFHIDFCFLSKNLIDKLTHVEIGCFEDWSQTSDHVPMIIEMDD
jgi:exonuclease III